MDYNVPLEKLGDGISTFKNETLCNLNLNDVISYFWIPVLILLLLLVLLKYREVIKVSILRIYSKTGYIRIHFRMPNKKIKDKLVKLDKFNNFKIGERKYNLEKMYDFVWGYDKYNFPIFLYDYQFIIPLSVTVETVTESIKKSLGLDDTEISEDVISALTMKIDSSILKTVYDKKLISDLYSISGDSDYKKYVLYAIIGIVALVFLYYTGYLDSILSYLG